jgi:hypothetical protein
LGLCLFERVDQFDRREEENTLSVMLNGLNAESSCKMRFPCFGASDQHHILGRVHELATMRVHRQGKRAKPLSEQGKDSNRTKSTAPARVEHVFGAQSNDMGNTLVRTIDLGRAKAKIGMKNFAYNMRWLKQLRRMNPCPA